MRSVKITVLMEERTVNPELCSEHGFALLLNIDDEQWLFDTGQSGLLLRNSRKLGIDLKKTKGIILSHGHYDHTGGLAEILKETGKITISAHPDIFSERFNCRKSNAKRLIGIPFSRETLERTGARFDLAVEGRKIADRIYLSGEIPRRIAFKVEDSILTVKKGDRYVPDPFLDDQFILIDCEDGVIMITGCCHAGLINSLLFTRELRPRKRIKAVVGGFHLRSIDHKEMEEIIRMLKSFDLGKIVTGHCTGARAETALARAYKGRFNTMKTGDIYRF